ncbi:MAG TPA: cobalt ECF transporter T component CbiQ [bacterium]
MSCHEADRLDRLSYLDSPAHRLDPRAKLLATLAFILAVVSFPKYEVSALAPFVFFPLALALAGGIPLRLIARRVLIVSPFAVMIGLFNPLLDRAPGIALGPVALSAGWLSFASILARFALTMSAALVLTATTSFPALCQALAGLRVPRAFVVQLLFLYRYLFVLAEESGRLRRARDLRGLGRAGRSLRTAAAALGVLFTRTLDRAERIYQAMAARGFDGTVRQLRTLRFRAADALFLAGVAGGAAALRLLPVTVWLGSVGSGR